jgi:CubicO group peptidase (beta-lactamase class C family)
MNMRRRQFLSLSAGLALMGATRRALAAEEPPFAEIGEKLDRAFEAGELANLHAVVVSLRGRRVLERYYAGVDEWWGKPLGRVEFTPDTLHDLRSVTKSIVGIVYGIALADGKVPAVDAPLLAQFPEYPDLAADPARQKLLVRHVLTMTLGTEWNEDLPYTDPANSEIAMEMAADRYRFILDRPIVAEPGTRWIYNGGATALLGRLIAKGTGMSLPDYAREKLFAPLGIAAFEWTRSKDGTPSAASGLRLTPRDLARIGELILNRGEWEGRSVVPASWLEASFRAAATIDPQRSYGLHWYMGDVPVGSPPRRESSVGAAGNGGQRLLVTPGMGLVVAIAAGNYNKPGQGQLPSKVWREFVLAGIG